MGGLRRVWYAELVVARIDSWSFTVRRRGTLSLRQETLLPPYSDGEDELAGMIGHDFFDPVYLNLGPCSIAMETEGGYVSNEVVTAPQAAWVDVVPEEHPGNGFGAD